MAAILHILQNNNLQRLMILESQQHHTKTSNKQLKFIIFNILYTYE